jgi:hypothetical protein
MAFPSCRAELRGGDQTPQHSIKNCRDQKTPLASRFEKKTGEETVRTRRLFSGLLLLAAASGIGPSATPVEAATSTISTRKAQSFVLTTGNIYFTENSGTTASLWRTGQTSSPGHETLVYSELNARFGKMIIASADNVSYAYFFVTRLSPLPQVTSIKRVKLTDGQASTIRTMVSPVTSTMPNLTTDGTFVYWQDRNAVRKAPICPDQENVPTTDSHRIAPGVPICGRTDVVIEATGANPRTAGLALREANLIYADGTDIRYLPTAASFVPVPALRTIARANGRVTALHVVANGVYWGEAGGAVRLKVGATTATLPSTPGLMPVSIATSGFTAGADQVWTQCPLTSDPCRMQFDLTGGRWSTPVGADARVGIRTNGTIFWSDSFGIHRQTF